MTKFRSLLFREFRINQKNIIINCLLLLAFYIFIFAAACIFVNVVKYVPEYAKEVPEYAEALASVANLLSLMSLLFSSLVFWDDKTFKTDLNSGWLGYSYGLPVTADERAAAVLAHSFCIHCVSFLLGTAGALGIGLIMNASFKIGYVVIQFILLDCMLLLRIIADFFVLRARNADEYNKLNDKGNLVGIAVMFCIVMTVMKCTGFDFGNIISPENNEAIPFELASEAAGIISGMTGGTLLLTVLITVVLAAVHFAVIRYRLRYAYLGGAKTRKAAAKAKSKKAADLTVPHSEPVGFLYKELKQNKKIIVTVSLLPFLVIIFLTVCVAIASLNRNNGLDGKIIKTVTSEVMRLVSAALGYLLTDGLLLSVFHGDDKKLWAYFTASVPNGVKRFLYTKYALSFAMCGLYFASSYFADSLAATVCFFSTGEEIVGFVGIYAVLFFVLLFRSSITIPLMLRFGEKKGSIINLTAILVLAMAAMTVFLIFSETILPWLLSLLDGNINDLAALTVGILPFVSAGAYILSYRVSCKLFMKGVTEYDK